MSFGNGNGNGRSQMRAGRVCAAVAVSLGLGMGCYYWWKQSRGLPKDGGRGDLSRESPVAKSRCIVVTETVCDLQGVVPWDRMLREDDVVFVVVPSCKGNFLARDQWSLSDREASRVMECDTMAGLWACVKSVRKQELYVVLGELPESSTKDEGVPIPSDIARYVGQIVELTTRDDLLRLFLPD